MSWTHSVLSWCLWSQPPKCQHAPYLNGHHLLFLWVLAGSTPWPPGLNRAFLCFPTSVPGLCPLQLSLHYIIMFFTFLQSCFVSFSPWNTLYQESCLGIAILINPNTAYGIVNKHLLNEWIQRWKSNWMHFYYISPAISFHLLKAKEDTKGKEKLHLSESIRRSLPHAQNGLKIWVL